MNILGRGVSLLNVAVDEGGDGLSRGVDLVLGLGHGQLLHHLLKRLERLGVLGLDVLGIVRSSRRHFVGGGWRESGGVEKVEVEGRWSLYGQRRRGLKNFWREKDRVNLSGGIKRSREKSDSQPLCYPGTTTQRMKVTLGQPRGRVSGERASNVPVEGPFYLLVGCLSL